MLDLDVPQLLQDWSNTLAQTNPCPPSQSCCIPQDILVTTKWSKQERKERRNKTTTTTTTHESQADAATAATANNSIRHNPSHPCTDDADDDYSVQRSPPPPAPITAADVLPLAVNFYRRTHDWDLPVSRVKVHWHRDTNVKHFYGIHKWKGQLYYTTTTTSPQDDPTTNHEPPRTVVGTIVCYEIQPLSSVRKSGHGATLLRSVDASLSKLSLLASSASLQSETLWSEHWENLPCLLISHVYVPPKYRGLGLGLALVDDACRKPGRDIPWVLVAHPSSTSSRQQSSLVDYFSLLGFCPDIFGSSFFARWNDLQHGNLPRIDNLCPHLPSSSFQAASPPRGGERTVTSCTPAADDDENDKENSHPTANNNNNNSTLEEEEDAAAGKGCGAVFSSTRSSSRCRRRRRVW